MTGDNTPAEATDVFERTGPTPETPVRKFNINFGPQHPAAHGVLRMVMELDRRVTRSRPDTLLQHSVAQRMRVRRLLGW